MLLSVNTSDLLKSLLAFYILFTTIFTLVAYRFLKVLTRAKPRPAAASTASSRTQQIQHRNERGHLLIVLGSGGHTAEMLSILQNLGAGYLNTRFAQRTWVVSTGDSFSAERARTFEEKIAREWATKAKEATGENGIQSQTGTEAAEVQVQWDIATVTRARKVHQPLYTTPFSALVCLWDCIRVLRNSHIVSNGKRTETMTVAPDLILTNGPGTGVIVVLASLVLLTLGFAPLHGKGSMRCVYVESWARVKTLSLSGKILRWTVSRFLVQWEGLADQDATAIVVERPKGRQEPQGDASSRVRIGKKSHSLPRTIEFVGAVVT